MAVLPPLKFRRHIPIILVLFLLFTKDLKEGRIIKRHSWIDCEVAKCFIQAHHIPSVGVLVSALVIFYIEGGMEKSVNWYCCCWDVGGVVVNIDLEVPINWTGDSGNGGYTISGALDWVFKWDWNNQPFLLWFKNWGIFPQGHANPFPNSHDCTRSTTLFSSRVRTWPFVFTRISPFSFRISYMASQTYLLISLVCLISLFFYLKIKSLALVYPKCMALLFGRFMMVLSLYQLFILMIFSFRQLFFAGDITWKLVVTLQGITDEETSKRMNNEGTNITE